VQVRSRYLGYFSLTGEGSSNIRQIKDCPSHGSNVKSSRDHNQTKYLKMFVAIKRVSKAERIKRIKKTAATLSSDLHSRWKVKT